MVAIALISRIVYPKLYSVAVGSSGADATVSAGTVPRFILPALSLATVTGVSATSAPESANSISSGGAVADGAMTPSGEGAVAIAPQGPVADSVFSRVGSGEPPSLAVEASLVADLSSGTRFMDQNATERWPLASVTKLMTATVVLDKLSSAQKITITQDAFDVDPSEKTLRVGDTYYVSDLLKFLLLPSSNVAAEALADAYGRAQFVSEMNARAKAWGMVDTHYDDPSGLAVGSESTAEDLVLLAQKIYTDYPGILATTRTPQATATEIDSERQVSITNINEFAGQGNFVGGKTGYTDQADGNLLSIFLDDGHPIVVVVLGTDDTARFANTASLYGWFTENFKL